MRTPTTAGTGRRPSGRRAPGTAALVLAALTAALVGSAGGAGPVAAAPTPRPAAGSSATVAPDATTRDGEAAADAAGAATEADQGSAGLTTALEDRRAEADRLRAEIDRLHEAVETAAEDYTQAMEDLAELVAGSLAAQARTDDLTRSAAVAHGERSGRIRALYMTGGDAGLYASVLDSTDLQDTMARIQSARSVVRAGVAAQEESDTARSLADTHAAAMARDTERRAELAGIAEKARATVTASLARTQALLADADADVLALAEARRAAAEREAARRAAQELARQQLLAAQQLAAVPPSGAVPGATVPGGAAAPAGAAGMALEVARGEQGKPYVWGATGPGSYDCSGLTQTAYRKAGVAIPRTSREQWYAGTHVGLGELAPGDLLFWAHDTNDPRTIHHVAFYAGNGLIVHAPHTGAVVRTAALWLEGYIGAVRPTSAEGGPA